MAGKFEEIQECPLCHKGEITVLVIKPYLAHHTSRISAGSKTTFHRTMEDYKVLCNKCDNCGATRAEMEGCLRNGKEKPVTAKEAVEKARKSGLPTQITWS